MYANYNVICARDRNNYANQYNIYAYDNNAL